MLTTPISAHVAVASLNQTVGDWSGNRARIQQVIAAARGRGVRLLGLPEMCISGYSLGDRLMMRGTLEQSWASLEALLPHTHGMVVCLGLPVRHREILYNCVAVVADGELVGLVPKENLASGNVEYESRWFSGWTRGHHEEFVDPHGAIVPFGTLLFEAPGLGRFGVEVCEDGWKGLRPGSVYALCGAQILLNPSASWFSVGKHRLRRRMVAQISREDHLAYLYTSLLGCDATRLIFDGSTLIAQDGDLLQEGRRLLFTEDAELIDAVVDLAGLQRARMQEGSWRQQVRALHRGEYGALPHLVKIPGDYSSPDPAPAPPLPWLAQDPPSAPDPSLQWVHASGLISRAPVARDLPYLELELALALGIREYQRKTGIPGVALALSGGRDSAMCALLIARSLRYDAPHLTGSALRAHIRGRFVTAWLGTAHSSDATEQAAASLADALGAEHLQVQIDEAVQTHIRLAGELAQTPLSWEDPAHDLPLQNVQARLRGSLIWMVANLRRFLLICTSNKSEAAVGYTTMDGDTSGGLAPIADVPKSLVEAWLRWAADFHEIPALQQVLATPATAELRPPSQAQTDEADLMPYEILDQLLQAFVQRGQGPLEIFRSLWPTLAPHYQGDPERFAAHIRKFIRLFCAAQWKRERFAISFRVGSFDLDPKTGFRFPAVQAPFTEELAEMDAYIAEHAP